MQYNVTPRQWGLQYNALTDVALCPHRPQHSGTEAYTLSYRRCTAYLHAVAVQDLELKDEVVCKSSESEGRQEQQRCSLVDRHSARKDVTTYSLVARTRYKVTKHENWCGHS